METNNYIVILDELNTILKIIESKVVDEDMVDLLIECYNETSNSEFKKIGIIQKCEAAEIDGAYFLSIDNAIKEIEYGVTDDINTSKFKYSIDGLRSFFITGN